MGRTFVVGVGVVALALVVAFVIPQAAMARGPSFTTPVFIGYRGGDDWEPDVAADGQGHVYVAWAHYGGVQGCDTCSSPAAMIQISKDDGRHWGDPKPVNPNPRPATDPFQVDLQVKVTAAGTVFVAYLDAKDTVLQRSDDFGVTFTEPIAVNAGLKGETDKVGLAVQGDDVYVAFDIVHKFYVASSHDGGRSFASARMVAEGEKRATTLTSGGVIDSTGTVYFSWVSVHEHGKHMTPQDVFLTKSSDGGRTWSTLFVEKGQPEGPNCDAFACGWDFWGPQMVVAVDAGNSVYVAYNTGTVEEGSPTVWFRSSDDGGASWSDRIAVHSDESAAYHMFPAIVGGAAGEVRVSWMDNRTGLFNTWYRSSTDGGVSWGKEIRVSKFVRGFDYKERAGYAFTYGDYYGIAWDGSHVHIAWGEGPDYIGPGNVWYATDQ